MSEFSKTNDDGIILQFISFGKTDAKDKCLKYLR
jgi:hypothetical protein